MMTVYTNPPADTWQELCKRPVKDSAAIQPVVQSIIEQVSQKGDAALLQYAKDFDGVALSQLQVAEEAITLAKKQTPAALKKAIQQAYKNILTFHKTQQTPVKKIKIANGIQCWRNSVAIDKVGLYIPGGSAPLFSTVLMLGIPAKIAGCKEIVLCTPCNKEGHIHAAILYAASLCGITKIYKTGGAQAIAAMAYGTASIPQVYKIFGPGNQYVTAAKQLVQHKVAIDMPAGPSEVLVIADDTADAGFVAADLLAQAEHGPDSQVVLVTTKKAIANAVQKQIRQQLALLPRLSIAAQALEKSIVVIVKNIPTAIAFSNQYAPEHLILACDTNNALLDKITNAGSVFIGNYSPESAGDYASGTNHTLPTNGYATAFSGVSLDSFVRKITFQQLSRKGLQHIADTVTTMAEAEGLQAHSNAVKIRLSK